MMAAVKVVDTLAIRVAWVFTKCSVALQKSRT